MLAPSAALVRLSKLKSERWYNIIYVRGFWVLPSPPRTSRLLQDPVPDTTWRLGHRVFTSCADLQDEVPPFLCPPVSQQTSGVPSLSRLDSSA